MRDEGPEACQQLFARRHVSFQPHPRARPVVQIAAVGGSIGGRRRYGGAGYAGSLRLRNHARHGTDHDSKPLHHHRGFVYHHTRFGPDQKSVEVHVRPRAGSAAACSGCHRPAPGYDHLPERRFEFIPFWGILVFFLYSMWHVQCRNCGVVVTPEAKSQRGCRSEGYGPGMKNALRRLQVKSQLPPHSHPAALLAALAVGTTVSWAADINCFLRNEKMNVADLETEMRKLVALFY